MDRFRPEEVSQLVLNFFEFFEFFVLSISQLGLGDFFSHCLSSLIVCQLQVKMPKTVPYSLKKEAVR